MLLDSGASALFVRTNVLHESHKILKDKKNKWSTMEGNFNNASIMEFISKLLEFSHNTEIHTKHHLT